MSQTLEDIQCYWTRRAAGFSEAVVLDLGAGAGFFSMILASLGHDVTAVDYSLGMLDKVKSNIQNAGLEAKIYRMDAQHLEFYDESFDAVVSRNVIWNLEEPEQAYREIYRVLKPGGTMMVADGNFYLHHHNEKYARAREEFRKKQDKTNSTHGHVRWNRGEVDFSIIETIAAERLPLSRQERPVWDFATLTGIGFRDIHVITVGKALPMGFKIIAKKSLTVDMIRD